MDEKKRAGILAILARKGHHEDGTTSMAYNVKERKAIEDAYKKKSGPVDISAVIQAAGLSPRPGPTPGVPRDMNAPQASLENQAAQVAQAAASNPGLSHIVGQPRDPNVAPTDPRQQMFQPRDPNVIPTTPRAPYDPRLGGDRAPNPAMTQGMGQVYGLASDLYGPKATTTPAAPTAPGNDPRFSADRAPSLSMLYKSDMDKKKDEKPKKQWVVPKGAQVPAGYHVVGDDGKGGQIVEEGGENPNDDKTQSAANQSYTAAGSAVASAAAPIIYNYLTAAPAAAEGAAGAGAAGTTAATTAAPTAAGGAAAGGAATTSASAASTAAAPAAEAATEGAAQTGGSYVGAVAPYLAVLYAIYKGYQKQQALEGGHRAVKGKLTDSEIDAAAAPPGDKLMGQVPKAIFGKEGQQDIHKLSGGHVLMQQLFGSTKHEDQLKRDRIRRGLKTAGLIDENFNITLPDGTQYQIGVEDKLDDGTNRHPYDVDFNKEEAGGIVGLLDPMSSIMTNADKKMRRDMTGFFANAVMSSPNDATANIRGLYEKAGLTRDTAREEITKQYEDGKIDELSRDAYYASLDRLFGVGAELTPYDSGSGGGGGGGKKPKPSSDSKPKPAPTLASIIPQNPPPPVMPEPDDEKTPEEQQAVNDYQAILGGKPNTAQPRKKKEKKPTKRYTYGR